jgi:hypothetical protein
MVLTIRVVPAPRTMFGSVAGRWLRSPSCALKLLSGELSRPNSAYSESQIGCTVLNVMTALGIPIFYRIAWPERKGCTNAKTKQDSYTKIESVEYDVEENANRQERRPEHDHRYSPA